jgi:hypothetical protein
MIDDYVRRFSECLASRGVAGRDRTRVLRETEDHLHELAVEHGEEGAVTRFGEPDPLAVEIGAQLATTKTIRSTYASFAALTLTAIAYLAFLALGDSRGSSPDLFSGDHLALGVAATLGLLVFPQVAFVCGGLALLRALRCRGAAALSCEELDVLGRRSAVALAAGGLTLVSMVLWGIEFRDLVPTLALSLVAALPLGVVTFALARASGPQAVSHGPPQDLFDDLRLARLRAHPWPFALLVSLLAAIPGFVTNGPILGVLEALAVLGCFAVLGRALALRP